MTYATAKLIHMENPNYLPCNLENISKKREDDLDMYLRLASDSRTMFKQGLKEARTQEKN